MAVLFGETIKQLRVSRKMTQQQLADRIGVARPMISSYENEIRQPAHETLVKIATVFNVSMDFLYNYRNGQNEPEIINVDGISTEDRFILEEVTRVFRRKSDS